MHFEAAKEEVEVATWPVAEQWAAAVAIRNLPVTRA
jgi:hypothetical protein